MRALWAVALLAAGCPTGQARPLYPVTSDEDDPAAYGDEARTPAAAEEPRAANAPGEAAIPEGPRIRQGTIVRAELNEVLDAGPSAFLRTIRVEPAFRGEEFEGWVLLSFAGEPGTLGRVDLIPGDVILTVNGRAIRRPEQLQEVWDALRTAPELVIVFRRAGRTHSLQFAIEE